MTYRFVFSACCALWIMVCACEMFAAQPAPAKIAHRLDKLIAQELFDEKTDLAGRSSDDVFLRRVWLDLVGDIPTPEQVIGFVLDPNEKKRARTVRTLLADEHYGQNWARYWRDVVFSRALDERSKMAMVAMEADLTRQFNDNEPWNRIAAGFTTAVGDVQKNGAAAIVMAQDGRTEETAAEISRVFLGIQIQCAQCHDHPYDRWKREQFHELAAFFPRVGVKPVRQLTRRSFEVFANDRPSRRRPNNNDNRPHAEHTMPNLDDPSAPGTPMEPKFFLTHAQVPVGTTDADRRQQLAEWLTENQWFSIAVVNRIWSELVGEGFYEPVDDIGPDRTASAPSAAKFLAKQFVKSGYDLKWLFRVICQTKAYQRQSRPRRGPEELPFTANVPQRLRSDQLINVLYSALEVDEGAGATSQQVSFFNPRARLRVRMQFAEIFGYDPSVIREEISMSIPQVLALMNAPQVNHLLTSRESTLLGRLLSEVDDDESLVVELYLRTLSRQPTAEELESALAYREQVENRNQAFEDLLWVLVNSVEFQYRR